MIEIHISFNPENGAVNVNGPIGDKIACYGVLEAAKDAIRDWHKQQLENRVQPASFLPPGIDLTKK